MFTRWIGFLSRRYGIVVALWVIIVAICLPLALNVTHKLSSTGFENPNSRAVWADNQAARLPALPKAAPLLIQGMSRQRIESLARHNGLDVHRLYAIPSGATVFLPPKTLSPHDLVPFRHDLAQSGATVTPVQTKTVGGKVVHDASTTLKMSGTLAIPFLVVLLLWVFGSVASAALPLVIAVAGSELALALVDLLENHITLSVYLTDIVSFLALGVGIDYALFINTRFRRELDQGHDISGALHIAMSRAGRSVFYSGLAVALAIATLLLGGTAYWRGLALGGAIAVLSTLLATHSLLPALLAWAGPRINWGRLPRWGHGHGMWPRIGKLVTRYPLPGFLAGLVILGAFSIEGVHLGMATPANLATMLPPSDPLNQAVRVQQRVLGPGSIAPITVAMMLPGTVDQTQTWSLVGEVASRIKRLPDVATVASPTLYPVPYSVLANANRHPAQSPMAVRQLVRPFINPAYNPHLVVLFVTSASGPDQPATFTLIRRINQTLSSVLPRTSQFGVGGLTSTLDSFNRLTAHRLPWILSAVSLVAFGVLLVASGSLAQSLLGVVFDGLVALATAGFLVYAVQGGRWGFQPQPLDSSITPLIFALLFGLSMDYEVILLHRIQEFVHSGRSSGQAAGDGLAATGAMITGAGLIMAVVFVVLLISPLQIMRTLGLGLTVAILLDTWVVRTVLVPASIALLGPGAFWPWGQKPPRNAPQSQE